jgi:hypothetical protein
MKLYECARLAFLCLRTHGATVLLQHFVQYLALSQLLCFQLPRRYRFLIHLESSLPCTAPLQPAKIYSNHDEVSS